MPKSLRILTIGASGFVGSKVTELLQKDGLQVVDIPHHFVDISNFSSTKNALAKNLSEIIINFAAFTDVKAAEQQRNDQNGDAWKINALGAGNVAKVAQELNKFLIYISTDHVFPISDDSKDPYTEDETLPNNPNKCSWYGFTKLKGEEMVLKNSPKAAIVRIASPFGNVQFPNKDYLTKLINSIKLGYGLFDDQQFTPTYIKILADVLKKIAFDKLNGKYHCVCSGVVTPYEVGCFLTSKLKLQLEIKRGSLAKLEQEKGRLPYAKFGGLSNTDTQKRLNFEFPTWQEAIDDFMPQLRLL